MTIKLELLLLGMRQQRMYMVASYEIFEKALQR